jgi:hypothetical protein
MSGSRSSSTYARLGSLRAGEPEHPRLVRAEPDLDVVHRRRAGLCAVDAVVAAVVLHRPAVGAPHGPDHVDRLGERGDGLRGGAPRAAAGRDRVGKGAGPEPQLDPPAAEDVQARGAAGQHDRRAQGQVGDVRRHPDVARLGRHDRQQRPGVEERRLVGVVLERDDVEPDNVGQPRQLHHAVGLRGDGRDEHAELEVVAVVGHRRCSAR